MQIHIHKDGKTYGAYSVDQVRQFLKVGNFTYNDLACHDGANWVKINEIPNIKESTKLVVDRKPTISEEQKTKKPRKRFFLYVGITLLLLTSICSLFFFFSNEDETEIAIQGKKDIFILTSNQVVDVYDGDTFKIVLPSMHPLFGDDLSIRLFGVDTPEMRGTSDEVKALAMQAQQVTEKALKGASKIELRNPQRGKYFRIISEVWIDGESLAEMLKSKGLAKDYDGEGARPEW